ncbi:hypothetical protein [Zobellia barbeyronii]|uniref:hypothetical protein n=1 Tax=Zobellia barbeyronii TaxID=2748009 RepID=UPI001CEC0651|nr:hypothetical protein [Zobellia barbeyronii]
MGTTGTILEKVYYEVIAKYNIEVIQPSEDIPFNVSNFGDAGQTSDFASGVCSIVTMNI